MVFEEREMKPYSEPITKNNLRVGEIYFSVNFIDGGMTIPVMEPLVFVGFDLEPGDSGRAYFQDVDSYRRGVGYHDDPGEQAVFYEGSENEVNHIFEYERALDVLLACSLRRRKKGKA